jgi:plastocyanin
MEIYLYLQLLIVVIVLIYYNLKRKVVAMRKVLLLIGLFSTIFFSGRVLGEVFVIKFGGTLGFTYSPNTLNVKVGDVIEWQGSFSFHPLSSTSVPAGANSFQASTGSVFDYTVLVPGDYSYQCDFHFSVGMTGSFSVLNPPLAVNENDKPFKYSLNQNYPNPFNPTTVISYQLQKAGPVTLKIYNILGTEIASLVNEFQSEGQYNVSFSGSELSSGVYFYELKTSEFNDIKKMILAK